MWNSMVVALGFGRWRLVVLGGSRIRDCVAKLAKLRERERVTIGGKNGGEGRRSQI